MKRFYDEMAKEILKRLSEHCLPRIRVSDEMGENYATFQSHLTLRTARPPGWEDRVFAAIDRVRIRMEAAERAYKEAA